MPTQHTSVSTRSNSALSGRLLETTIEQIVALQSKGTNSPEPDQIRQVFRTVMAPADELRRVAKEDKEWEDSVKEMVAKNESGAATGRLADGFNGYFYNAIADRLTKELSKSKVKRGSAPETLTEVCNVMLLASLAERLPDYPLVTSWVNSLKQTRFAFMTQVVANAIVKGFDPNECGVAPSGMRWDKSMAITMLETIVYICDGTDATDGYAQLIVDHIVKASKDKAIPGEYEMPDGRIIISIIALSRLGLKPDADAAVFQEVFSRIFETNCDLFETLPEHLKALSYLWSGPNVEPRVPARRLAESVLCDTDWLHTWSAPVSDDRLSIELSFDPLAYPRGMAKRSCGGTVNRMVTHAHGDQADGLGATGETSRNVEEGTTGQLRLLSSPDQRYQFAPLSITLIGKQNTGKTTLLSGVIHDLLHRSLQPIPRYEIAFHDETQRFALDNADHWARKADHERTTALLARYGISIGPVDIELTEIRGHELDPFSAFEKICETNHEVGQGSETGEADQMEDTSRTGEAGQISQADKLNHEVARTESNDSPDSNSLEPPHDRDQEQLVEHIRRSDGMILMISTPEFISAVRDGEDRLDKETKHKLGLQRVALANIMNQIDRVNGNRGPDHRAVALVVSHGDKIFEKGDLDAVYRSAALLRDVDRGGFGTAGTDKDGVGDCIKSFALRTPIGTVSLQAQKQVVRIIDMMKPVLSFVARMTRRYEIFLTTGLPRPVDSSRQLASGPGQIVQWLLDSLMPSYVEQALAQIQADRAALVGFKTLLKTAKIYARPLSAPGRFQDAIEYLPGGRKLLKYYRNRWTGKLKVCLKRAGVKLEETEPEPLAIEAALMELADRIGFTRNAINTIAAELEEFRAALSNSN